MFWYQCRYCKVNFDQWEKLVTHRRDEHKLEFEALKRRSAILLRRQETAANRKNKLIGKEEENRCSNVNFTHVKSLPLYITTNRMKPTTNTPNTAATTLSSTPSTPATPTRRNNHNHQSSSKELDSKDLENQEIALCIPSSSSSSALGLRYASPLFSRDSPPPFLFLTPTTSPSQNGNSTTSRYSDRTERLFGYGQPPPPPSSTITSNSFVTPPVTPPRQLPPSPLLSVEELVLNMHMNWSPPAFARKAVQYHEISDDDEIEFSITPSSGSQITVTKHSTRGNNLVQMIQGPVYINGENREYMAESRIQSRVSKHVMVENLEHELQMTCSSSSTNGGGGGDPDDVIVQTRSNGGIVAERTSGGEEGPVVDEASREPDRVGGRLRSELTERRLKRLHSQLQLGQQNQSIARFNSAATSNSTALNSGAGEGNGCKRMRVHSTNQVYVVVDDINHSSTNTNESRSATVNTSSKTSPRVSTRINTRASPRRPNK